MSVPDRTEEVAPHIVERLHCGAWKQLAIHFCEKTGSRRARSISIFPR